MRKVIPYLFFDGNCKEAMTFYAQVFDGKLEVLTMADAPPSDHPIPEEMKSHVMYSCVTTGDFMLRASDRMGGSDVSGPPTGIDMSLDFATVEETRAMFAELSKGGHVVSAPQATFFSPCFGTLKDKFGVSWMLVTEMPS